MKPTKDDDDDDDDANNQRHGLTSLNQLISFLLKGMRRVGIDDSRLFSLADKPYALFAGVAPVGQARQTAATTIWSPFFQLRTTADIFWKIGRSHP